MKNFIFILMTFYSFDFVAQIISQFTWDSNPVTMADIGPNAISVSSSATSSPNGVGGTNGLNAGLPKQDIYLIIADNPIFDVGGIDISFDYQRDESHGAFFSRGNSLVIDGCSNLSVRYRVDNGVGSFFTISSGNAYAIPNDNTFRTYRFIYIPVSGIGSLLVNGTIVWSNDGPDGRDLYWTGAGDIIIGSQMDGSGSNRAFLDNLTIGEVSNSALPIELTYFEAEKINNDYVNLSWETLSEINNDFFTIERSTNGQEWMELTFVPGAGNSNSVISYTKIDYKPFKGTSFYRLKQTDFNGNYTYSQVRTVKISSTNESNLSIYPNPTKDLITIESTEDLSGDLFLFNSLGQEINSQVKINRTQANSMQIDLSSIANGIYFVKSNSTIQRVVKN